MSERIIPFYLPISSCDAVSFLMEAKVPASSIERAGLFAMIVSLKGGTGRAGLHKMIFDAQVLFSKEESVGAQKLLDLRDGLDDEDPSCVISRLAVKGLIFADSSVVRNWISKNIDGNYDENFQKICRNEINDYEISIHDSYGLSEEDEFSDHDSYDLSDEEEFSADSYNNSTCRRIVPLRGPRDQEVAMRVISGSLDEVISLNAYAGTGKTHLVLALANSVKREMTYVAPRKAHLDGLMIRKGSVAYGAMREITLYQLAHDIAQNYSRSSSSLPKRCIKSPSSLGEQADYAEIPGFGGMGSVQVFLAIRKGINAWCQTDDLSISKEHFRRVLPFGVDFDFFVILAERLWKMMFSPLKGGKVVFDVNLSHLAKWLSLCGAPMPAKYGTIIVDESHDLLPSWRRLLSKYESGCVLMGDPYQRLGGYFRDDISAKRISMSHSMRMGAVGESLVEKAVSLAPIKLIDGEFHGSRNHVTLIKNYKSKNDFPNTGLRVYGNEWEILADALKMKKSGFRFGFVPETADHLRKLVRDAVSLYLSGETYKAARVSGCSSWEELASMLESNGRGNVVRMFDRGFREENFIELLRAQCPEIDKRVTLSLIEHAKNFEMSVVAINECCFSNEIGRRGYLPLHANYLAMTRARDEIWLPGDAMDRLSQVWQESL